MFQVRALQTFVDAPLNLISGIGDMLLATVGSRLMLYTTTRAGGGLLSFEIGAGGMLLTSQGQIAARGTLSAPPTLDLYQLGSTQHLIYSGLEDSTLVSFRLNADGTLRGSSRPAGGPAGIISAQALVTSGNQTLLYAATTGSGLITTYSVAATNGVMTRLGALQLGPDLAGINISGMAVFGIGSTQFVAVTSQSVDRIDILRLAANGLPTVAGSIGASDGLGISAPSAVRFCEAHGSPYLAVASGSSSSITLLALSPGGTMTVADQIIDTLDTRFRAVVTLETINIKGRSFLVAGGGDGGLHVFEILPGGRFVIAATMLQQDGLALQNITALALQPGATGFWIYVAGEGTGVTRLYVETGALPAPLMGTGAADTLTGGAGHDLISGGAGDDVLYGGAGDDILIDGAGVDRLYGGAGADLFVLSSDGVVDYIHDYQPGIDRLDLSAWGRFYGLSDLTITSLAGGARIRYGKEELIVYSANGLPLTAASFASAGLFDLWHGDYTMLTPDGMIAGTPGADYLVGTDGDDLFLASTGQDTIQGGNGFDHIDFSEINAAIRVDLQMRAGIAGPVQGQVYLSIEAMTGTAYNDTLLGDASGNVIQGAGGNDVLYGRGGNDTLYGGDGDDWLYGGEGADWLYGGAGRDRAHYGDAPAGVRADLQAPGTNTGIAAGDRFFGIEGLVGSAFNDMLLGDASGNEIQGAGGNDVLYGRDGNDTLYGGDGDDTLYGGAGADWLYGGAGRDRAHYGDAPAGVRADLQVPGTNTGIAAGDRFFGIEDLVGSAFNDILLGDASGNEIQGAGGNDVLYGRDGNDTLYGGDGDDTLYGGAGADWLYGGAGRDRAHYGDAPAGMRADLQAPGTNTGIAAGDRFFGIEDLVGSAFNDILLGDASGNEIQGAGGNDVLYGRDGNDTLYGGDGDDTLYGGAGADWLYGGAGRDRAHYGDAPAGVRADLQAPGTNTGIAAGDRFFGIEDLVGSAFNDMLLGDASGNEIQGAGGNDVLYGRDGNDTLYGGDGNDWLYGGDGNDWLHGGPGRDVFLFLSAPGAANADRIADFNPAEDMILLDDAVFTALNLGLLGAARFTIGESATTDAHRIVYNQASGQIYYDPDGSGAAGMLIFASVTPGTLLTADHFLII
ncbi:hypothetical protein [Pseudomonas sp. GX19020]|uniref:hypothetical protein n=1 Tax=Pseudomonas sp. GX19020 TaxID=2942277 RepID=UPI0024B713C0|nr:hypothetical protein [Pseudomonas sp. GX19020]